MIFKVMCSWLGGISDRGRRLMGPAALPTRTNMSRHGVRRIGGEASNGVAPSPLPLLYRASQAVVLAVLGGELCAAFACTDRIPTPHSPPPPGRTGGGHVPEYGLSRYRSLWFVWVFR